MALSEQDFNKGVDFTGLAAVTAADLNNLVDLAEPVADNGQAEGKGLVIVTTDSALDTPVVPTALIVLKWQKYIWFRKPFDATGELKLYGWDNNLAVPDVTLSYWVQLFPDTAEFDAAIAAIQLDATAALAAANNAMASATAANTNAALAQIDAAEAVNTANAVSSTATDANTKAQEALDTSNALADDVSAAVTAASAKKDVNAALIPGLVGLQRIRTNATSTAVEWFNVKDTYIRLSETKAFNTDCGDAVNGENVRNMNTEDYNTQATVLSAPADSKFTLPAGTYHCRIEVPGYADSKKHQAFLRTNAGVTVLNGTSATMASASKVLAVSVISGIFTLAAATKLKISDYWDGNTGTGYGLGEAANVNPDGGNEVYTIAEFWRIG